MKHLIKYKLFESSEDIYNIQKDCEDILLELNDIGYTTNVLMGLDPKKDDWESPDWVKIYLTPPKNLLTRIDRSGSTYYDISPTEYINTLKEYLLRLEDYLGQFGLKSEHNVLGIPIIKNPLFRSNINFNNNVILVNPSEVEFRKSPLKPDLKIKGEIKKGYSF